MALGMSQRQLGRAIGVATFMISKYENGACAFPAARIYQFSEQLNTSPAYFFDGFENHIGEFPGKQRLVLRFIRSVSQIENAAHRKVLNHVVRALSGHDADASCNSTAPVEVVRASGLSESPSAPLAVG